MKKSEVCAIIAAAGESLRMNGVDKIMTTLAGKPVLVWSIEAFQSSPLVDRIVLVNSQKTLEPVQCLVIDQKWSKVADVCTGGRRRQDSVAAGLRVLGSCEWVIIHDGARPLVTRELIERGLEAARETGAAAAAVPVTDTVKLAGDDRTVIETLPRRNLWAVQTPQVFRTDILKEAYRQVRGDVTDDAALVEQTGTRVKLYEGSYDNIKITTPRDLAIAEVLMKEHAW
ncbi:MAG: 2-C-methyl-D-erythritol 4-phosphate cytidylyltransferase [Dehalococcoidales bacterium]|nr:2-C-methyl-D-erythritol 4-phosphate cytidylyltransferase [Dehalococcoidales bacterium]